MRGLLVVLVLAVPMVAIGQDASGEPKPGLVSSDIWGLVEERLNDVAAVPLAVSDPTTSVPRTGAFPEAQPVAGDLLTGSFQVSSTTSGVSASLAPFVLAKTPSFFLFDSARIELRSGGSLKPWGGTISMGYSSAANDLRLDDKKADVLKKVVAGRCLSMEAKQALVVEELAERLNSTLEKQVVREPGEPLNYFAGRITAAWKNQATGGPQDAVAAVQLEAAQKAYVEGVGNCAVKIFDAKRVEEAFKHGFSILGKAGFDWFPYSSGPALPDAEGVLQKPTPHAYQGHFFGADFGYFPAENVAIWLTVAYAETRVKVSDARRRGRISEGVTVGFRRSITSLSLSGFQPSLGVGGFVRGTHCRSDEGCSQVVANYKDPLAIRSGMSWGGYLELRASQTVQVQISLPVDRYKLSSAIADSDGVTRVRQFVPTLSVAVSSWSI